MASTFAEVFVVPGVLVAGRKHLNLVGVKILYDLHIFVVVTKSIFLGI